MKTEIEIIDNEDYEKWALNFEGGEIHILRDGFENGTGIYSGVFDIQKVKKLYEAMKSYYEKLKTGNNE